MDPPVVTPDIPHEEVETEILLAISSAIAETREKGDLLHVISSRLRVLFDFTHSAIGILNGDKKTFRLYLLDPNSRSVSHPDYSQVVTRPDFPVTDGVFNIAMGSPSPVLIDLDAHERSTGLPPYLKINYDLGVKEAVMIALRKDGENFGVLGLFAGKRNAFNDHNLRIIRGISSQLSVAVANILANEEKDQNRNEIATLLSISNDIASIRDKTDLLQVVQGKLKSLFKFNDSAVVIFNGDRSTYRVFLYDCESPRAEHPNFERILDFDYPTNDGIHDLALNSEGAVAIDISRLDLEKPNLKFIYETGIREIAAVKLRDSDRVFGIMTLLSETTNAFSDADLRLLLGISNQISIAIANVLANEKIERQLEEINRYKQQLEIEKQYLQTEVHVAYNYGEIVGDGPEMQKVFRLMSQVAPSESTVLILGETGTGKELIARAIHNSSHRRDKLMVKVNCAALPPTLVESELFGHERGSFTGAVEKRIGKFELANNGTLFLDEIGELSLELQAKLLRAIQEREIERVGGKDTIKLNVRIIAATNRNLINEINAGRFRTDLFYRLNVFPISLPPLRDRTNDIPVLALHFISKFARNSGRDVHTISDRVLQELKAYEWPGNVRELEHLIERSVLLTSGKTIREMHLPSIERIGGSPSSREMTVKTIDENERDHILFVLRKCEGKISGYGGAAEMLGVPYSTLNSRIKKLGITKKHIFAGGPDA